MKLPEITEVERLTLKPDDVLFVHVDQRLDAKIIVLDRGITVTAGSS